MTSEIICRREWWRVRNIPKVVLAGLMLLLIFRSNSAASASADVTFQTTPYLVEPGDTWSALSLRFGIDGSELQAANAFPNRQRQPTIGKTILIPGQVNSERHGKLITALSGGLIRLAVQYSMSPWELSLVNQLASPYRPLLNRSVLVPDGQSRISQLPVGVERLELSNNIARPGEAMAVALIGSNLESLQVDIGGQPFKLFTTADHAVGIFGTGAFLSPGEYELRFTAPDLPSWSQPWLFEHGDWTYEDITLTGSAAAIDAQSIQLERERLAQIWAEIVDRPLWDSQFQLPISDFLSISSEYGTRRSYNGGPYGSYHEGLDFSAYGGTPVKAPAAGTVVLAEQLYVRGGAVIISHGLGVFTGVYHQEEVLVEAGQTVVQGQVVGRVGSTGLSTGNHLHWDLLVGGTWVDPQAWLDSDLANWILSHWSPEGEGPRQS